MTELIVALDTDNYEQAHLLISKLSGMVNWIKIGSVLYSTPDGPKLIELCKKMGFKVMLDLKYHDIPNTVEKACYNASRELQADMLTIHLSGGSKMIEGALDGITKASVMSDKISANTKVLGISVLTSIDTEMLNEELNIDLDVESFVDTLIDLGVATGINGIVCSPLETKQIRERYKDLIIVNPGIRLILDDKADQKRTTTPKMAKENGANFIVMGRSIINAEDPRKIIEKVLEDLK